MSSQKYPNQLARQHVHDHSGITSCDHGHCHMHPGVTGPPIPTGNNNHYHELKGLTTYDHGHHHYYCARTEQAVFLSNGQHTHYVDFRTSFNLDHDHRINGYVQVIEAETHHTYPPSPCYPMKQQTVEPDGSEKK